MSPKEKQILLVSQAGFLVCYYFIKEYNPREHKKEWSRSYIGMCYLDGNKLTDGSVSLYYPRGHINDCLSKRGEFAARAGKSNPLETGEAVRILSGA